MGKTGNCFYTEFLVETYNDEEVYRHAYDYIVYAGNIEDARKLAIEHARNWYGDDGNDVVVVCPKDGNAYCEFETIGSVVSVTNLCPITEGDYINLLLKKHSINPPREASSGLKLNFSGHA